MRRFILTCSCILLTALVGVQMHSIARAQSAQVPYSCCYDPTGSGGFCDTYTTQSACLNASGCSWNPLCGPASALEALIDLFTTFFRWLPFFGILAGGVFLLIGGFRYVISGDDTEEAEQARQVIFYAILGIVLSGFLWVLARILVAIIPGLSQYIQTGNP